MHKLILSIIAVAFLQIGFITYVTSDKTSDNAGIYKVPTIDPPAVPAADDENIEVASLDKDPVLRREKRNLENTARFKKADHAVRRKVTRVVRRSRVQLAPFVSEHVIITYAVQKPYKFVEREPYRNVPFYDEPVVNKPEIVEQPLMKTERSNGNPIINVIKKPYSWIKALGSKLK